MRLLNVKTSLSACATPTFSLCSAYIEKWIRTHQHHDMEQGCIQAQTNIAIWTDVCKHKTTPRYGERFTGINKYHDMEERRIQAQNSTMILREIYKHKQITRCGGETYTSTNQRCPTRFLFLVNPIGGRREQAPTSYAENHLQQGATAFLTTLWEWLLYRTQLDEDNVARDMHCRSSKWHANTSRR